MPTLGLMEFACLLTAMAGMSALADWLGWLE